MDGLYLRSTAAVRFLTWAGPKRTASPEGSEQNDPENGRIHPPWTEDADGAHALMALVDSQEVRLAIDVPARVADDVEDGCTDQGHAEDECCAGGPARPREPPSRRQEHGCGHDDTERDDPERGGTDPRRPRKIEASAESRRYRAAEVAKGASVLDDEERHRAGDRGAENGGGSREPQPGRWPKERHAPDASSGSGGGLGDFDEPGTSPRSPPQRRQRQILRIPVVAQPGALGGNGVPHVRVRLAQCLEQRRADGPATDPFLRVGIVSDPEDVRSRRSSNHAQSCRSAPGGDTYPFG